MKKDYNSKKKSTIVALSLVAVCLAGGLFYYMGTLGNSEPSVRPVESKSPVETEIVVPEIQPESVTVTPHETSSVPESIPAVESTPETSSQPTTNGDVVSKPSEGKPKSPTEAIPPAEEPKDTAEQAPVENPDTNGQCQPEQQPKPESGQPQGGETQGGKIYVPGFGWIEDSGEENGTIIAPNAGTGEKVGDM